MVRTALQSVLCLLLSPLLVAQQFSYALSEQSGQTVDSISSPRSAATGMTQNAGATLPRKTIVDFVLLKPVSSATAKKGQTVPLAVAKDVIIDGTVMIPKGTPASGVVKDVRPAIPHKRDGYVSIKPVSISVTGGFEIPVRPYYGGGDEVCDGFGNCFGLILMMVALVPPMAIASAIKALFHRDNSKVLGIDQKLVPCWEFWATTSTKSRLDSIVLHPPHSTSNSSLLDLSCPFGESNAFMSAGIEYVR